MWKCSRLVSHNACLHNYVLLFSQDLYSDNKKISPEDNPKVINMHISYVSILVLQVLTKGLSFSSEAALQSYSKPQHKDNYTLNQTEEVIMHYHIINMLLYHS